ncbi:hypothetical protein DYY66_0603 [Candidatus Nitrosotalea sp. FS]|nr:hypothetical protein [Candidatus Nitrosotalea sp. FS]
MHPIFHAYYVYHQIVIPCSNYLQICNDILIKMKYSFKKNQQSGGPGGHYPSCATGPQIKLNQDLL